MAIRRTGRVLRQFVILILTHLETKKRRMLCCTEKQYRRRRIQYNTHVRMDYNEGKIRQRQWGDVEELRRSMGQRIRIHDARETKDLVWKVWKVVGDRGRQT